MGNYKIAVYTIALNEEKHVKRWFDSAKDADFLFIADTGSTDRTRYLAKSLGIVVNQIEVVPWRFDVARNASLAMVPQEVDICIQLDMDETLPKGWRKKIEEAYDQGNKWPIYKHVTSRDTDGNPRTYQHYFKIHPRQGFSWKYPIHEILVHDINLVFDRKIIDLEVDHVQDQSKSRHSYLVLLEKAIQEFPDDWRMNHYLNREYFYRKDWLKVLQTTYRCEQILNGWDVERASTYMWGSEAALQLAMPALSEEWAHKSTEAAPHFYESWHWRAHIAHLNNKWNECFEYASKRISLARQDHHLVKPEIWEWWGFDLMALSGHNLGKTGEALFYGEIAFFNNPGNRRLRTNLDFYRAASRGESALTYKLSVADKMIGFPTLHIISLIDDSVRRRKMNDRLRDFPSLSYKFIDATRSESPDYQDIQNSILESHLDALTYFLEKSNEAWTVVAEDDVNFELVKYWTFTWQEKFEHLQSHNIEIAQLSLHTNKVEELDTELHPRKVGIDWGAALYLVSREGAEKILKKSIFRDLPVEENLFTGLRVFSEALFTCDIDNESAFHANFQDSVFAVSFKKALTEMKNRDPNAKLENNDNEKTTK